MMRRPMTSKSRRFRLESNKATELRRIIHASLEIPLEALMLRGFTWFREELFPAISALKVPGSTGKAAVFAKTAWELLGDVYFVVSAPFSALWAYEIALKMMPGDSELVDEIAVTQEFISIGGSGDRRVGPKGRSIAMRWTRARTKPGIVSVVGDPDLDERGIDDWVWKASELILQGRARDAVKILDGRPGWQSTKLLVRALSVAEQFTTALDELIVAIHNSDKLHFCPSDWFFLPDILWESNALWKALYDNRTKLADLGLVNFTDSSGNVGPIKWTRIPNVGREMASRAAVLQLHCARTSCDIRQMKQLASRFRSWTDASRAVEFYRLHKRFPMKCELIELTHGVG